MVEHPALWFGVEDLPLEAQGSHEEGHEVDQEPFVLEVEQGGLGPAAQAQCVHGEAVGESDEKRGDDGAS